MTAPTGAVILVPPPRAGKRAGEAAFLMPGRTGEGSRPRGRREVERIKSDGVNGA